MVLCSNSIRHNFVRTLVTEGAHLKNIPRFVRWRPNTPPRGTSANTPYPLARTFAPPPHFRPHHNRILGFHILQFVKSVELGFDLERGKRV